MDNCLNQTKPITEAIKEDPVVMVNASGLSNDNCFYQSAFKRNIESITKLFTLLFNFYPLKVRSKGNFNSLENVHKNPFFLPLNLWHPYCPYVCQRKDNKNW